VNGAPAKGLYRKFHLEEADAGDDVRSMEEITYRRYSRLKEEGLSYPDLILVDGGITQVRAGVRALAKAGVDIPVYGLYKNDRHQTEGIVDQGEKTYPLNNRSSLFFLLMRMQDEVHRFAISFHKRERLKRMKSTLFDGIAGIGEKRKETLRKHYPTLESLKNASLDELRQILPDEVAGALFARIGTL
jgi:excinuclease ABC subunit C